MSFSQSPGWTAPPQPSMGDTINMLTGVRNYQAQQAQANAYAGAIDPNTGAFDQNKYNALLVGQGTRGTWGGGAAMQQAGQASQALGAGTIEQIGAQRAQIASLNGVLTPLIQQAGPQGAITREQAQAAVDNAARLGTVTPAFQQQATAVLARTQPGENVRPLVDSMQWMTQTADAQLAGVTPGQTRMDVGPANVGVGANPWMRGYGQPAAGTGIQLGLTPGQQVTPVEIKMSDGSVQQVLPANVPGFLKQNPGAYILAPGNYTPYRPPGAPATTPAPAPAPAPAPQVAPQTPPQPPGGGRVAGPGVPPPAPPAPAQPAPAPSQPPLTVGPPPQAVAGQSPGLGAAEAANIGVGAAGGLGTASGGSPQRQAILGDMASSLSGSTPLNTGVASDFVGKWSNFVNAMLPETLSSLVPGMSQQQLATLEGFHKMAEQLRQQQAGQISGALTNDKFASALASSPNAALSTLGNLGMIHILQGNEDAINAKNQAWQQSKAQGWQDRDYMTWQNQYNQTPSADPRVYWLQHMQKAERDRLVQGMAPAERASLRNHYNALFPNG